MTSHLTKLLYVPALMLAIAPAAYAVTFEDTGSCIGIPACIAVPPTMTTDALFNTIEGRGPDEANNTNNALLHVQVGPNNTSEFTSAARGHNTYSTTGMFKLTQSIPTSGDFEFTIQPGEVTVSRGIGDNPLPLLPTQFVEASLDISLVAAGISKFHVLKMLRFESINSIIDHTEPVGSDFFTLDLAESTLNLVKYTFGPLTMTVPVDPGLLTYEIDAKASGNITFFASPGTAAGIRQGMSIARTGDPIGESTPPGGFSPLPVPEPSSLSLVGIGLTGLAFLIPAARRYVPRGRAGRFDPNAAPGPA